MSNEEIERLERISAFYEKGDYMDQLLAEREVEIIQMICRDRRNALEVGCGNGFCTERLVSIFGDELEVLEPSAGNITLMRKRIRKEITTYNSLLEDFTPSKKYKSIFFLNVLEHVEDPIGALRRLESMLEYEGLVFVSAPNCMSLNRRAGFMMGLLPSYDQLAPKDYELGHRRLYTVEMLREHCVMAGLRVIAMKGIYLKPLAERQMIDLGENAVRAFYSLGEDIPEYCANLLAIATKKWY